MENEKIMIEKFMDWQIREFTSSDWNDIMEVLYKITKLGIDYNAQGNKLIEAIWNGLAVCLIERVYFALVDFIQWYNLGIL